MANSLNATRLAEGVSYTLVASSIHRRFCEFVAGLLIMLNSVLTAFNGVEHPLYYMLGIWLRPPRTSNAKVLIGTFVINRPFQYNFFFANRSVKTLSCASPVNIISDGRPRCDHAPVALSTDWMLDQTLPRPRRAL